MRQRSDLGAILALLGAALLLRLIIAYVLVPGAGFGVDLASFRAWAADLAAHGPFGFYSRGFFADYTPGYLYVLWVVGLVGNALGGIGDLIKLPAMLADVATGYMIWSLTRDLGGSKRAALIGAAFFAFNPVSWFDSAVWGQVDSVGTLVLLLAVREIWKRRPESATALATLAVVIKPQYGILIPLLVVILVRRHFVHREAGGPKRIATSFGVALLTASVLAAPFGLLLPDLVMRVVTTAGEYHYVTANAFNPWAFASANGSGLIESLSWLADAPSSVDSTYFSFGPIPAVVVGTALLILVIDIACHVAWKRDDRRGFLLALLILAIAFFVVPTRVHERYLYPAFALAAIFAATSVQWRLPYVVLSIANFLNLYAILTMPFYKNPVKDWLGIGEGLRSGFAIGVIALAHLGVFLWVLWRALRPVPGVETESAEGAVGLGWGLLPGGLLPERLLPAFARPGAGGRPPVEAAVEPAVEAEGGLPHASVSLPAAPPTASQPSRWGAHPIRAAESDESHDPFGWPLREIVPARFLTRPSTPDRSKELKREGRGRLDLLDLFMVIVLIASVLTLRTWRLAEPYQMQFDEVYHARTATEFLQDWRYGEPHDIYEYTHPHLAKYLIAAGIVGFGDNQVVAQSDLGTSVRDAAIEPRWEDLADKTTSSERLGDRLYVATGSEVRAYDLADRTLISAMPVPGALSVAVDTHTHRLLIGTSSGQILTLSTSEVLDVLREGGSPAVIPSPFAQVSGAAWKIATSSNGSIGVLTGAAGSGGVAFVDGGTGALLATTTVEGAADIVAVGTSQALVAEIGQVEDAAVAASVLAPILGTDEATLTQTLSGDASEVTLAVTLGTDARTQVQAAIDAGTLPGVMFTEAPRFAVAGTQGVSFLVHGSPAAIQLISMDSPATGMAVTSGLDQTYVYVASGHTLEIVSAGTSSNDKGASVATLSEPLPMPGEVSDVSYNDAVRMIHVLGKTADGSASTVYVVEPHGNAVYADAKLPFTPSAWVMDANEDYPSIDREQLITFDATGAVASVDVGSNQFAWRLPGVIAGALTAGLLYLLARILFRRRSVAVIAGLFALFDGMLFVQSRIAMNDVYVGLFIVAAYTLFAAIWTGAWKWRGAFWVAMPAIGVLLGLAVASKWVGAYALAGLGLLILTRSALGRAILIVVLAAATGVLGYMGIVVPTSATTSGPNYIFLIIMIAVTGLAGVVSVLRPIRWSLEEMRFAVVAPGVIGAVLAAAGLTLGGLSGSTAATTGSSSGSISGLVLTAGFGLIALAIGAAAAFPLAGRFGWGPLAKRSEAAEAEASALGIEPPEPPAQGWLQLGSMWGIPTAWILLSIVVIPIVVYVASYIPWFALGHPLIAGFPKGVTGQSFIDLQKSMYDYHNNLRATHPASSPWWAWPLDLKPVWFFQEFFAGSTAGAVYDGGNLVLWWLGIPAMAFVGWQAWARRSLPLALISIGFMFQWIPWVRIDRATFEYHYYVSVLFISLAFSYFIAELWNGPSPRTWLLIRVSAAVAALGPAILWVFRAPLCVYVRVDAAYANSPACRQGGDLTIETGLAAMLVVAAIGLGAIVWLYRRWVEEDRAAAARAWEGGASGAGSAQAPGFVRSMGPLAIVAIATAVLAPLALAVGGHGVLFKLAQIPVEILALGMAIPLAVGAAICLTARNPRRLAVGILLSAVGLFVLFYPNWSGLPLPSTIFNAYQGILPTWLYPFQFPDNTDSAVSVKILDVWPMVLIVAALAVAIMAGYSASQWRFALAERRLETAEGADGPPGGSAAPDEELSTHAEEPSDDRPDPGAS